MISFALTYSDLGRHDDALKMKEDVLEFRRRVLPPNHPDIATSMNNLAVTKFDLDAVDEAIDLEQGAVEMLERAGFAADHPTMLKLRQRLELWRSSST
jgi:hypothetical protein